jgi:hypothetical protein
MSYTPLVADALGMLREYIRAPRTSLPIRKWLDQKYNWHPHRGQDRILDLVEQALGTEGFLNEIDVLAGKRSGKTELVKRIALYLTLGQSKRGWVLAPTWKLVDRIFQPMFDLIAASDVPILEADRTGRRITTSTGGVLEGLTWGAEFQIEGEGIHFCICDETQQMSPAVYDMIRARMVGNYLWVRIGSPAEEGRSFYEEHAMELADVLPNHRLFRWPTWLNPDEDIQQGLHIERQRLATLRKELGKDSPLYRRELAWYKRVRGGKTGKPSDLVIGSFDADIQVRPCPFDESLPVYLFIDPGYYPAHYAVTVFQPHLMGEALGLPIQPERKELWQIDEFYEQQRVTDSIIRELKGKPWWKNVDKAVIDVSARQTNRQTGIREVDVWQSMVGFPVLSQYVPAMESINTLRQWCANSRIFHDPSCKHTLKEYQLWKMRQTGGKEIPGEVWNDALQATSYGLVNLFGYTDVPAKPIVWHRQVNVDNRRTLWR